MPVGQRQSLNYPHSVKHRELQARGLREGCWSLLPLHTFRDFLGRSAFFSLLFSGINPRPWQIQLCIGPTITVNGAKVPEQKRHSEVGLMYLPWTERQRFQRVNDRLLSRTFSIT